VDYSTVSCLVSRLRLGVIYHNVPARRELGTIRSPLTAKDSSILADYRRVIVGTQLEGCMSKRLVDSSALFDGHLGHVVADTTS
jgi:hypothetical protein